MKKRKRKSELFFLRLKFLHFSLFAGTTLKKAWKLGNFRRLSKFTYRLQWNTQLSRGNIQKSKNASITKVFDFLKKIKLTISEI